MLQIDTIVFGDLVSEIGEEWHVDFAKATLFTWCVNPGQVCKLRIGRDSNDFGFKIAKFGGSIAKRNDLGRTNERKVKWIEKEYEVFARKVGELEIDEFAIVYSCATEIGRWF